MVIYPTVSHDPVINIIPARVAIGYNGSDSGPESFMHSNITHGILKLSPARYPTYRLSLSIFRDHSKKRMM